MNVIKEIRCGDYTYPLLSPLSQKDLIDLGRFFLMRPLSANIVERAVHESFQRVYRTPPHEVTESDQELWNLLLSFIDYEGYVRKNPLPENLVGRLIKKDLFEVVISWFGGNEEIFDFRNFPSDIITATPGSTIHAKLKRYPGGSIKWIDCSISRELRSDEEMWQECDD